MGTKKQRLHVHFNSNGVTASCADIDRIRETLRENGFTLTKRLGWMRGNEPAGIYHDRTKNRWYTTFTPRAS